MINELQVFSYEGSEIRTVQLSGECWWVLKDICDVLELSNPSVIADRLDEDEKAKVEPKQYLGSRSNEPATVISGKRSLQCDSALPKARSKEVQTLDHARSVAYNPKARRICHSLQTGRDDQRPRRLD